MAVFETWLNQDLQKPLKPQVLDGSLFTQDNAGNLVGVVLFNNGEPAQLVGTVSGSVIRADGATVATDAGVISDNKAYVLLPESAYAVPGQIVIVIKLTTGSTVTTIGAAIAFVQRSATGTIIDPGDIIPSIANLIDALENAESLIPADKAAIMAAIAPDFSSGTYHPGQYVWYNGKLYVFTAEHSGTWDISHVREAAVGSDFAKSKSIILEYGSYDTLADIGLPNHNFQGITATWDGEKYTVSGTASANTNLNLYVNSSGFPGHIVPGDLLTFNVSNTSDNLNIHLYFYINGAWGELRVVSDGYQVIVPDDAAGILIRFFVESGKTVGGTCSFGIAKSETNGTIEAAVPVIVPSDTIDKTALIADVLTKYGIAQFAKGTYIVNNLQMPDNTILRGCGDSTILKATAGNDCIKLGTNCTVENLRITCDGGHTTVRGAGSGIFVQGNYDSSPMRYNGKISNVTVDGFACAGLHGLKTGYWVANSLSVVNCKFVSCWAGILFEDKCEFNRVTNCLCYNNYIGAHIYSGNNTIENTSLSNNTVGLYLEGSEQQLSANNGHGAVIGCTLNHNDENNGYAIIARQITHGFIINGCNIWYDKVLIDTSDTPSAGIIISNCLFGGGTPRIINYGGEALLLSACMFETTPSITGDATTIKSACYTFAGEAVE